MTLPAHGLETDALFRRLESFRSDDLPWRQGRTLAYVYDPGPEAEEVIKRAFASFLTENALDPTSFPSALRLENEVVGMAIAHLRGDEQAAGSFTSGGTESLFLALKTARDWARAHRPNIGVPEVVLPETAHASFQKAAHYLGLKAVLVPVDPQTFRADVQLMREAITPDTVLLVGSAASYAHGVVDPIRELGELALEHGLLLHVDACIGGFVLPYFRRLGAPVPDFDFTVPGVTSISMDFHKYAYAAKGASVILYRNKDLRRHQLYACANWPGYTVINSTVQSSKSAGPVAACWAVLNHFGDAGYLDIAKRTLEGMRRVIEGIESVPGLRLMTRPDMNLIAFTSDEVNVFHIADEMKVRGWYVQPQLSFGASKENIHLSLGPGAADWADEFARDLRDATEAARQLPSGQLAPLLEGMDFSQLTPEGIQGMLAMTGATADGTPDRMAAINEVLNALPPAVRETVLVEYLNELFRASRTRSAATAA